jgi:hypothetical protein
VHPRYSVYSLDCVRTRHANDAKSAKGGGARQFNGLLDVYRKTLASQASKSPRLSWSTRRPTPQSDESGLAVVDGAGIDKPQSYWSVMLTTLAPELAHVRRGLPNHTHFRGRCDWWSCAYSVEARPNVCMGHTYIGEALAVVHVLQFLLFDSWRDFQRWINGLQGLAQQSYTLQ